MSQINGELSRASYRDFVDALVGESPSRFSKLITAGPPAPVFDVLPIPMSPAMEEIQATSRLHRGKPEIKITVNVDHVKKLSPILDMAALLRKGLDAQMLKEMSLGHLYNGGITHSRDFIEQHIDEINIRDFLSRVEHTIGLTIHECSHPDPDASPGTIQNRLAQALRLMWWYDSMENFIHDADLVHSRRSLHELDARLRGADRHQSLLTALVNRARDELDHMRRAEKTLRAELADPDCDCRAYRYDSNFFEGIIGAAFDAALRLEANFETRLFGEAEAA